jgi:hypothetical protein
MFDSVFMKYNEFNIIVNMQIDSSKFSLTLGSELYILPVNLFLTCLVVLEVFKKFEDLFYSIIHKKQFLLFIQLDQMFLHNEGIVCVVRIFNLKFSRKVV